MSQYIVFHDLDDDGDTVGGTTSYFLTPRFWEGDDSFVRDEAMVFADHDAARHALALFLLANHQIDWREMRIQAVEPTEDPV